MISKRNPDKRAAERRRASSKSRPLAKAPWPNQKARQEMSETEVARDNLGKHSKNRDWEKRW